MAKRAARNVAASQTSGSLSESVKRLADELKVFRQVIDELREEFSWLAHNGLPVQPIRHAHVKRMAADPCADDWGERLEIDQFVQPISERSPCVPDMLDLVVQELESTLNAIAQGQLDVIIGVLDYMRADLLAALKRQQSGKPQPTSDPTLESEAAAVPEASVTMPSPETKPPPGRLF